MYKLLITTVLLLCLTTALLFESKGAVMNNDTSSEIPLYVTEVILCEGERNLFFKTMKRFSEEEGFAYRLAPVTPDGDRFIVEMWRSDYKIFSLNSFDTNIFKVRIYSNDTNEVPKKFLDKLVEKLRYALSDAGLEVSE